MHIRIRGTVQGVGFRPTVARLARSAGLRGFVRNDLDGVLIGLAAEPQACSAFVSRLLAELPPLAIVQSVEQSAPSPADVAVLGSLTDFQIVSSAAQGAEVTVGVGADAAICDACRQECIDPYERRFRYPFGTCTHCGPRFSVTRALPYDRQQTTLAGFAPCAACQAEYGDPQDRRYHAQTIACHACGPRATLERSDGRVFDYTRYSMLDQVDAASSLLLAGEIVAVKGIGGYQLCCDATDDRAVQRLRERKRRPDKPLAMMAASTEIIRRYAELSGDAAALLASSAAPIVLLDRLSTSPVGPVRPLSEAVAPGQRRLGFMLPATPLHVLLFARVGRPLVCTSGNLSEEPQCIDDSEARSRLSQVADWLLTHDRPIAQRVDDSVVAWFAGAPRMLRRARGYAPHSLSLPVGLQDAPAVLATGGDKKAVFALSSNGRVVLAPHQGELAQLRSFEAWQSALTLLSGVTGHAPCEVVTDSHPEYHSRQAGQAIARDRGLGLRTVQHHHAHFAACLAENGRGLAEQRALGIVFDGLGYGAKGELWGGEFLLGSYAQCRRVGTLKPVALLGGDLAARQPWRNLYAHLRAEMSWGELKASFGDVEPVQDLLSRPVELLEGMLQQRLAAPLASSTGRLFDAVAAALNLHRESISYEGQAAMALEALVTPERLAQAAEISYPLALPRLANGLPYLEPLGMWRALLGDLWAGTDPGLIAARFHRWLAEGTLRMALYICSQLPESARPTTVALSGGVFQNRVLFELVMDGMQEAGFEVLTHRSLPPNDGCLALGQVAVAAARYKIAEQASGPQAAPRTEQ